MATILVTGSAGFIGSNYVRARLAEAGDDRIVGLDALTYAGNLENLAGFETNPRYRFVRVDLRDAAELAKALDGESIDDIVHFAAESHVDRSIVDATNFLTTNVVGTQVLLDFARSRAVRRFVHVSTDEVYGSLGPNDAPFTPEHPLRPNSPYAASKAASDLLVRAAKETHGLPVLTTRCSNNYGPYQFPEKLIPLMIANALDGQRLPVYGDGRNVRDWIHVSDHCRGIELVRQRGRIGEIYNLGAGHELTNLDVVRAILEIVGRPESLITYVTDRLGHDRRYAIDPSRAQDELGFSATISFSAGLRDTVRWYTENRRWWERVRSGAYLDYYLAHYGWQLEGR